MSSFGEAMYHRQWLDDKNLRKRLIRAKERGDKFFCKTDKQYDYSSHQEIYFKNLESAKVWLRTHPYKFIYSIESELNKNNVADRKKKTKKSKSKRKCRCK